MKEKSGFVISWKKKQLNRSDGIIGGRVVPGNSPFLIREGEYERGVGAFAGIPLQGYYREKP